ncbi:hypothetical protein RB598_004259 [Gaeumannomyces tritici]
MENKAPSGIQVNSPYLPLQGERVIRLATIGPGSWLDDVRCELTNWPLDPSHRPAYQTLSYVWGSARVTEEIFLNGIPWQVTVNLSCALRYLRHSTHPAIFWIDALCINQQDVKERSAQVPLIRDIYSQASGLTIFLGNGISHRTPRAFHKTHTPSAARHDFSSSSGAGGDPGDRQVVTDFWNSWRTRQQRSNDQSNSALSVFCLLWFLAYDTSTTPTWPLPELLDAERERDVRGLFEAVRLMLLSPWWSRVWVVQEVAVAREPVTIRLGDVSAPWDLIARAAKHPCLLPESKSQSPGATAGQQERQLQPEYAKVLQHFARTIVNIETLRARWLDGGGYPMLSLLQEFGSRDATDERDKVYALMGLAGTNNPVAISADYAMSVKDVYKQTAVSLLDSTHALAFLAGNQTRKNRRDLPSWVPDWGAIIEPGDRARATVIDLYQVNHQWARVQVPGGFPDCNYTAVDTGTDTPAVTEIYSAADIYWTSSGDGLRNLVNTLQDSRTCPWWWEHCIPRITTALWAHMDFTSELLQCPELRRPRKESSVRQIIPDETELTRILQRYLPASRDDKTSNNWFLNPLEMNAYFGAFFFENPRSAFQWLLNLLPWCHSDSSLPGILALCDCPSGHPDPNPALDIVSHLLAPHLELDHTIPRGLDILKMQSLFTGGVIRKVGERLITWDSGSENHALQVIYSWHMIALELQSRFLTTDELFTMGWVLPVEDQAIIANTLVGGLRAVETEGDESVRYIKLESQADPEQEQADLMYWFATHLTPAVDKAMEGPPYHQSLSARLRSSNFSRKPPSAAYNPQHFNMAMKLATEGRAFFIATSGFMGMGPSSVLPGDEVHILRSGQTHMVLRQTLHGSRTTFKVIGDCYLYPESPETSEDTWKSCWPIYWRDVLPVPDFLHWPSGLHAWNLQPRREWVRLA